MLKEVPAVKTTCTTTELITAFVAAWVELYGDIPKKSSIGVLFAQNALETGLTKSMWNFNVGNVKAVNDPNGVVEYCALHGVWEIVNGKKIILPPENPGSWFRSFPSLKEGIKFHLNFIKNKRYKSAWASVLSGDPAGFSHQLKLNGYYTDSEQNYTANMKAYFNKYMAWAYFENAVKELPVKQNISPVSEPKHEEPIIAPTSEQTTTTNENKSTEIVPTINKWQKIQEAVFDVLKKMPWIKLFDWLATLGKK